MTPRVDPSPAASSAGRSPARRGGRRSVGPHPPSGSTARQPGSAACVAEELRSPLEAALQLGVATRDIRRDDDVADAHLMDPGGVEAGGQELAHDPRNLALQK